jgi:hypothetical protein
MAVYTIETEIPRSCKQPQNFFFCYNWIVSFNSILESFFFCIWNNFNCEIRFRFCVSFLRVDVHEVWFYQEKETNERRDEEVFNTIIQWTHNVMDGHVGALKFHWLLPAMPTDPLCDVAGVVDQRTNTHR